MILRIKLVAKSEDLSHHSNSPVRNLRFLPVAGSVWDQLIPDPTPDQPQPMGGFSLFNVTEGTYDHFEIGKYYRLHLETEAV